MEFNSQICTTKEQSERLRALGLKKETADMVILEHPRKEERYFYIAKEDANWDGFPAWSLHRLLRLCPLYRVDVSCQYVTYDYRNEYPKDFTKHKNVYDNLIDCIEWLIIVGCFKKEYLEEK